MKDKHDDIMDSLRYSFVNVEKATEVFGKFAAISPVDHAHSVPRGAPARAPEKPPTPAEQLEAERDRARRERDLARAELASVRRDMDAILSESVRRIGRIAILENDVRRLKAELAARAPGLDREFVGDLIKLTHPDRHVPGLAALANKITAKLLEMRR